MRTGVPQRLLPLAFPALRRIAGLAGAGAPLLGGLRPLGLCFAAAVPTLRGVRRRGRPDTLCCRWQTPRLTLAGAAVVALLRGLAGTRRQNYAPMAPATAAGIVFCLIRSGLAVAGYAGLPGILSRRGRSAACAGAVYLLVGFFACPGRAECLRTPRAPRFCFALMALLACLTPYTVLGLSVARAAAALTVPQLLRPAGRREQPP